MLTIILLHSVPILIVAFYTRSLFALNVAAAISAFIALISGNSAYLIFDLTGIGIAYFFGRRIILQHLRTQPPTSAFQQDHKADIISTRLITSINIYASQKRLDFELYRRRVWPRLIDPLLRKKVAEEINRYLNMHAPLYRFSEFWALTKSAYATAAEVIIIRQFDSEIAKKRLGSDRYERNIRLLSGNHDWDLLGGLASFVGMICLNWPTRPADSSQTSGYTPPTNYGNAQTEESSIHGYQDPRADTGKNTHENKRTDRTSPIRQGFREWIVVGGFAGFAALLVVLLASMSTEQAQRQNVPGVTVSTHSAETRAAASLPRSEIRKPDPSVIGEIQRRLNAMAYDSGPVDGVVGPRTRRAIIQFQRDFNLVINGSNYSLVLDVLRRNSDCILTEGQMTPQDYRRCGIPPPSH